MSTQPVELSFGAKTFPLADIVWGIEQAKKKDALASATLALGSKLVLSPVSSTDALIFSEMVCRWGRGERVFANLKRHHGANLGPLLSQALEHASNTNDAESAITPLCAIKGLGVSFASKHLRMMRPDRFGVLDSRFKETLGFALNASGYALFMKHLGAFQDELDQVAQISFRNLPISTVENGLFFLVQPKAIKRLQQERSLAS